MAAIPNLDLLTSVDSDVDAEFICAMMNDEKKFRDILSVIRQTGKCQNGGDKKTKHVKQSKQSIFFFPKNEHFLPLNTSMYVSGGKKCLFLGKFDVLCFLVTSVLRFTHLTYYRP